MGSHSYHFVCDAVHIFRLIFFVHKCIVNGSIRYTSNEHSNRILDLARLEPLSTACCKSVSSNNASNLNILSINTNIQSTKAYGNMFCMHSKCPASTCKFMKKIKMLAPRVYNSEIIAVSCFNSLKNRYFQCLLC